MTKIRYAVLCVISWFLIVCSSSPSHAQSSNDGFDPNASSAVFDIAMQPDGKILACGAFTTINGESRNRIARLNINGSLDTSFTGSVDNELVSSIVTQSDGRILIGGWFTAVSGVTRNFLARLNSDGALDASFDAKIAYTASPGDGVMSIAVQSDGKFIIGGQFSTISSVTRTNIARLNSDGSLDNTFNPGADNIVRSIAIQPDGKIVVAGEFVNIGGANITSIARLNSNGMFDSSFVDPVVSGPVSSVAIQPDGKILIGGLFTVTAGTVTYTNIARLNSNGSLDTSFDQSMTTNNYVWKISLQPDGKILIGGHFTEVGGVARNKIARLNSNGSLDTTFDPNANGLVTSLLVQPDGRILIAGEFTQVASTTRNNIARLSLSGRLDKTLSIALSRTDNHAYAYPISVQPDGKFVVAGHFSNISSTTRYTRMLARVTEDGVIETGFDPKPNAEVETSVILPDGKILIGGYFTAFNGAGRNYIARLNSDGSLDAGYIPYSWNYVSAMTLLPDGGVIAVGKIATGQQLYNIAANGSANELADFTGSPDSVDAIAVQPDGKIIVAGYFTAVNGTARNYIARLNSDGSLDTGFNANITVNTELPNNHVSAIAVQPDGKIVIAGYFSEVDGTSRSRIARLNSNGTLDTGFAAHVDPSNTYSSVSALALQPDGKIVVGGWFSNISSTTKHNRNNIARLNSDGSVDEDFNPDADAMVTAMTLQSDGKLLVSGTFLNIGGAAQQYFARLAATGIAAQEIEVTIETEGTIMLEWFRSGTGPELSHVWFEKSSDGTTWTSLGNATRITGGWRITGVPVVFDANIYLRARGIAHGGHYSAADSLAESVKLVYFAGTTLTVSKTGTGSGTVTSVPTGINCGTDCSEMYPKDILVTLTATASPDSRLAGWSGACSASSGDCVVDIQADDGVVAAFEKVIEIKDGAAITSVTASHLDLNMSGATRMRFMFNGTAWTAWEAYSTSKTITLPTGDGVKTVYAQFDNDTAIYSDTIILDTKAPTGTIMIEYGEPMTDKLDVTLSFTATDNNEVTEMCVSSTATCPNTAAGYDWESFKATRLFTLAGTAGVYGTKYAYVKFRDSAGKVSAAVSDTISYVQKITSAVNDGTIIINSGLTYATSATVSLGITNPGTYNQMKFSNDGITWTAYELIKTPRSYTLPAGDGSKFVYVKFKEGLNESGAYYDNITLDTKGPVGTVLINNGAISTNDVNVTLQLDATDVNGVSQMCITTGTAPCAGWVGYATTANIALLAGDGTKKVSVQFKDSAGNVSAVVSDSILLDTLAPVGTVKINSGALTTTNPLVKLTLAAPTAVQMQINADGTWGKWEPFMTAKEVTIPNTAGDKTVSVKFRDYTGNDSTTSAIITMVLPPAFTNGTISIRGTGTGSAYTTSTAVTADIVTGSYTHMQFSTNNTTWSAWEGIKPTKTITLPTGDGVKYVLAKFKTNDVVDPATYGDTITLDTKPPTGSIIINANAAFTNISTVTVSVNAFDANGVSEMNFSLNGITWLGWESYATTKTLTLTAPDGTKKVSAKFKDNAGKESAVVYDSIIYDTTPPVGKVVINAGAVSTTSLLVTLTLTAPTATMMQISVDGGTTWGSWETFAATKKVTLPPVADEKTVQVKFRDLIGNVSIAEDTILYRYTITVSGTDKLSGIPGKANAIKAYFLPSGGTGATIADKLNNTTYKATCTKAGTAISCTIAGIPHTESGMVILQRSYTGAATAKKGDHASRQVAVDKNNTSVTADLEKRLDEPGNTPLNLEIRFYFPNPYDFSAGDGGFVAIDVSKLGAGAYTALTTNTREITVAEINSGDFTFVDTLIDCSWDIWSKTVYVNNEIFYIIGAGHKFSSNGATPRAFVAGDAAGNFKLATANIVPGLIETAYVLK